MDATGCGDTYVTGYLYMRNKASYEEAGCFAAAMSTLKLEASGPFNGTEEDVWNVIHKDNRILLIVLWIHVLPARNKTNHTKRYERYDK